MSADHLSDEDAEAMSRAAFPRRWSVFENVSLMSKDVADDARADQIAAMRRAWAVRPEKESRL